MSAQGKTEAGVLHLIDHKLGEHKGGRRVWLEGKRLVDAGFKDGVRYQVAAQGDALVLSLSPAGTHKVSRGGVERPIVDLITRALGSPVERVQVAFYPRRITLTLHPIDAAAQRRLARVNARVQGGQKLRLGSVCHGGGVASSAILRGLPAAEMALAVEQNPEYLAQSLRRGPLAQGGVSFQCDLGDLGSSPEMLAQLPEVDVLEAGLPCISASRAGRAKKNLAQAEDDQATADLAHALLNVVSWTRPATIVLENVPEYADTASAAMIRRNLERLGYRLSERVIDGAEWSLEARQRWLLVATSDRAADLDGLTGGERPAALAEVLDKRTPAAAWRSTAALDAQLADARAKGQGFARGRKLLTAADTSVPTLRRGYQKGGKCDVRLAHPTRPGIARLFSAAEHARIKGIDPALVSGLSEKKAHEILGQSVIAPAFTALGAVIGAL